MLQLRIGILRAVSVFVPVAAGALAIAFSGLLAEEPGVKQRKRPPTPIRVVTLEPVMLTPRAVGYGQIEPVREWRAVARIEGEIAATCSFLAEGQIVEKGEDLLRFDESDIRLSLAQIDAQLSALDVRDKTLGASLVLAEKDLELSRRDLKRQEDLAGRGVSAAASLDEARRQELSALSKVVEYQNQLALNAAERSVLSTQRASAARSLEFTTISAPYDLRILSVSAEAGQVVSKGQTLMETEGTEAVEVNAQFPLGRMGPVVRALEPGKTVFDMKAAVRLIAPDHIIAWPATVSRVSEAIETRTQSTGIVVRVEDPLGQATPGKRPPLRRNTFVEVVLSAPPREAFVVPVEAVRNDQALFVTSEGKVVRRDVGVAYRVNALAVLSGGVNAGDVLVVADPALVMPGMLVKPVEDEALKRQINQLATGKRPVNGNMPGKSSRSTKGAGAQK